MFPINKERRVDVKRDVYETNNQPKKATFKYDKEGRFFLGLAKVEIKEDGTITGKCCPVFDYTGSKIVTIDAYKKEILNEFARIRKLTSSSSPWAEKIETDKIWLYASVGKLKGIGKQGEVKINEINIHTISDLQRYVRSYGLPKLPIHGLGQIYEYVMVALPRKPTPSIKYHRKEKNPNFSIYLEIWVEKLKSSSSISKF